MNNNLIICPNCGRNNKQNNKFCEYCGNALNQLNNAKTVQEPEETEEDAKKAKELGLISLALYFLGTTICGLFRSMLPDSLSPIITSMAGLCPTAGIITMVYGRIKYPKNKFLKIVMWIIIATIIVGIIVSIVLFIACMMMCGQIATNPNCG